MVRIKAKATDPLIVPAIDTIESSLLVTVHLSLLNSLNIMARPKIAVSLEMTQTSSSKAIKLREMT